MRCSPGHKHETHERVLRSAARELRRHGAEKLGVAEVMKGAGFTHGGFYAHFASKDELIVDAILGMFRDAIAEFERCTSSKQAREGVTDYVNGYLTRSHRDARDVGCPIAALATEVPRMKPDARHAFESGTAKLASAIAGKLREMQVPHEGELASSMLAELVGALLLARCATDVQVARRLLDASRSQIMRRLHAAKAG